MNSRTYMRTIITLALAIPLLATAQTDTTRTPGGEHSFELGYAPGKGFGARVEPLDSATRADANGYDTIRFETRRKVWTILTEPKAISLEDSITDVLHRLRRERRNLFTYWSGLDVGLNNYVNSSGSFDLESINFMEQKIQFGSHHIGLVTGLGLEFRNYLLANNVALQYDNDSTWAVQVNEPAFKKNKLRQTGLRMPLLLEINTKRAPMPTADDVRSGKATSFSRKGNFHMAVGVIGTWYFDTMYKTKYRLDGETKKDRSGGGYNLEPLAASATLRIGYGGLNLFAEYGLTQLFKTDRGPELTPVTVGLTLIGFN